MDEDKWRKSDGHREERQEELEREGEGDKEKAVGGKAG